uniref:restriction endonuclease subunit S n=1 Tax=uncultured Parolsenella sp. TaxID=2083008 RepID=UPI00344CA3F2
MGVNFIRETIDAGIVCAAGQNTISQGVLKSILVPVPPLAEQRRIVDALDKYLALVDGIER